ncbi:hypothetical protein LJR175_004388 [Variovorax sp. LjRoot175]|uniref:hypothetical protein n=1 Tax=Variovorax sp. LjRoot175 TaxID=3342276 RepID=UPI003ECDA1C7
MILGLGPDLLPIVADPSAPVRSGSSLQGKIGKVPSLFDQNGLVMGFTNWTVHSTSDAEISRWSSEPRFGIGVQTRDLVGIDLDLTDANLVDRVARRIEIRLGMRLPVRSRTNSSRCLLVCRVSGSRKKTVIPTDHGRIEILGEGQQFVAGGMHPSGEFYSWDGDGPNGLPAVIPAVPSSLFDACIADLRAEFGTKLHLSIPAKPVVSDDLDALVSGETLADLESATMHLAAVGYGREYDDWAWTGNMLKSLGDPAKGLFLRYSLALGNEKPGEAEKKWPQLRADRAGYRAVFTKAQALGWINPRKAATPESVLERFKRMPRADILKEWAPLAAAMSKESGADFMALVHEQTSVGKLILRQSLNDARRHLARDKRKNAFELRAAARKMIALQPENSVAQAREVGDELIKNEPPGTLVLFNSMVSRVREAPPPYMHRVDDSTEPPPPRLVVETHTETSMRELVENHVVMCELRDDLLAPIQVPKIILDPLLELNAANAPTIRGLLTHAIVLPDGSILSTNGLDPTTGLYVSGITNTNYRPYSVAEAAEARLRLKRVVLDGFEFASPLDEEVALAGLFTAIQRTLMDAAPGLAALAGAQSSGKTTLLRRIHVLATGRDMAVSTLAIGDEAEIKKSILGMLMSAPAMVVFDNVPDGFTVHSGVLGGVMTSSVFSARLLGGNRNVEALTNVLFCLSGNNLTLGADEITRWMVTRLEPKRARPEERQFRNSDVVGHALSISDAVLRDVIGIIAGFIKSGDRLALSGTRFPAWDRMVRQPLIWAGGGDVAQVFRMNEEDSEHAQSLRALVRLLRAAFGDETFYARHVAELVTGFPSGESRDPDLGPKLRDALEGLAARDPSKAKSVSRVLNAKAERWVQVDEMTGEALRLTRRVDGDGVACFAIRP